MHQHISNTGYDIWFLLTVDPFCASQIIIYLTIGVFYPVLEQVMVQRIYHGELTATNVANALLAHFNRGNLMAQEIRGSDQVIVQIATRNRPASGGETAISVIIQPVEDGVAIQLGKQTWLGVAASLGMTALSAWRNPLSLINRLDDLAQDIENLQISTDIWQVIDDTARVSGATTELTERLRRLVCAYCQTANPVGESNCIACGAPMGEVQLHTCLNCGFVVRKDEKICPNCKSNL
jgi:RNA polymerase subunit RPABC4/transcription elongation factor Spt4